MTLDEIKAWSMLGGVACIVTSGQGGWVTTACGHWRTGDATFGRPKRVCRKCREALPNLRPTAALGKG